MPYFFPMFYGDVPEFEWLIFGSHAAKKAHAASDVDAAIRFAEGIDAHEAIQHPFFVDIFSRLKTHAVDQGGVLDLFLVDRKAKTIQNVFRPENDLARGDAAQFEKVSSTFQPIFGPALFQLVGRWSQIAEPRGPIQGFAASIAGAQKRFIEENQGISRTR